MKIEITHDEWYPVYGIKKDENSKIEISQELYDRYINSLVEFNAVQTILENI